MKNRLPIALTLVCILLFNACNKWNDGEFEAPIYDGAPANRYLKDVIAECDNEGNPTLISPDGASFVVKAVVASSDEGSNFAKYMVVQDDSAAVQIQMNQTAIYNTYPPGQTVYIDCRGLAVDYYHGIYRIGCLSGEAIKGLDPNVWDNYIHKDGWPQELHPKDIYSKNDIRKSNIGRLVRLHQCEFGDTDAGKHWSEESASTSRKIVTLMGDSVDNLVVRTSNLAKFRRECVPEEPCDLVGILSVYNNEYRLLLRTADDVLCGSTAK